MCLVNALVKQEMDNAYSMPANADLLLKSASRTSGKFSLRYT